MKNRIIFVFFFLFCPIIPFSHASYPSSAHLLLKKEIERITYLKGGAYIDEDEVYLTVLDEKGKQDAKIQSFYINRHYSEFKIQLLEVISPDGKRYKVNIEKNSRLEEPASDVEMNIYDPNVKVLKVFIPRLKAGDTIHYKTWEKMFKPIIPDQIYGMIVIQRKFPVKSYNFELILPEKKKLYYLIKKKAGIVFFKEVSLDKKKKYIWEFKDIPMLFPEPNMIPYYRVSMRLLFSTIPSWEDVSRWYYNLVEPKLRPSKEIIKKVKELIKGKKTDLEKIKAIFYFVSRKIRYLGIIAESKRPGFEPHDVSLTFKRRYGVCRDKAALLVCMLRIAGFHAAPVLLSMGNKLDKEIVVPYFNHAIAAVLDKEGNPIYFLDPTSETSKQLLPDYDRDCSYLIAYKKGGYLGTTPINLPEKNLIQIKIKDSLGKDGIIRGEIYGKCLGFVDTVFRSILLNKSYYEQKRFLIRFFEGKRPGLRIKEVKFSNPMDMKTPFCFFLKFELRNAVISKKNSLFIWPLSCIKYPGILDKWILGKANLIKRRYPLRFGYVFSDIWEEKLDLSALKKGIEEMRLPVSLNRENDIFLDYTYFSLLPEEGIIKIKRYFSLRKLEVSPEKYLFVTRLQHDKRYESLFPLLIRLKSKVR